ncbi:12043_t:CDS:2 [Funneliformis geosporum]|uniref:1689_t:CDS:1 n=1 Tax=Funneliformis geosporum TaxID=1117311 RepID=A0A9W4WY28_9GLOM|nr:12043_t:CDS:2 [Funneliformis geosporum]CAI2172155.1 1689_t:CDS:2 [Funneliformis geosporum]
MFSRETFIHDAELDIVVPNDTLICNEEKIDDVIFAQQRTQTYYDEILHFYLIITLPPESNLANKDEAINFFKKLDVTLETTLTGTTNYSSQLVYLNPSPLSSVSGYDTRSRSNSDATSPSVPGTPISIYSSNSTCDKKISGKVTDGIIIYSAQCNSKKKNNNKMVVVERNDCWICVLPLSSPVVYAKSCVQSPAIALNITVTQIPVSREIVDSDLYSMENFGINLLEGLNDDPAFESLNTSCSISATSTKRTSIYSALPSTYIKRCSRKVLSVKSALNVRMRTTSISPLENSLMMSIELENNIENNSVFTIDDVKVEVTHGIVTRYTWGFSNDKFPISLQPIDQATFLYSITILEDPSFPKPTNATQLCPTPSHLKSSKSDSIASIHSLNASPVENKQRSLSITIKGCPMIDGVKSPFIESKWNCTLDLPTLLKSDDLTASSYLGGMKTPSTLSTRSSLYLPKTPHSIMNDSPILKHKSFDVDGINGILSNGRLPILQKQSNNANVCDDVVVSFVVDGNPVVGQVFIVNAFIVNKSSHSRSFTIMVPNKKRSNEKSLKIQSQLSNKTLSSTETYITLIENNHEDIKPLEDPFMDETEFLRKNWEFETSDSDLICLDNNVRISPINPCTSESVALHFISTKEALHFIELIQLVDNDTGFITNLRKVIQVYVEKSAR